MIGAFEADASVTSLSVIALDRDVPPVVIPTGKGAEGLAVSPDGREVWVVNRVAQTISVVDTQSLAVSATVGVPPDARRAEISREGRVLVPHAAPEDAAPAQYLSVYDRARRTLVGRLTRHEGRSGPGGFGILIAGERAFASDRAGRAVLSMELADIAAARDWVTCAAMAVSRSTVIGFLLAEVLVFLLAVLAHGGVVIQGYEHAKAATAEARLVGPDGTLYAHATTTCLVFELR